MTEIDFTRKLIAADDVILRELDGEAVILHLGDESYYGLNESGTRMWQLLTSGDSIEAAFRSLLEEFEVGEETLRADLCQLVGSLLDSKMVRFA